MRTTMRLSLLTLALAMVATSAPAAELEPQIVMVDPQNDHTLWFSVDPNSTPPVFDLRAGLIGETDETIDFTWVYWDIPDGSGGLFEGSVSYWEFQLEPAGGVPVLYSLRARPTWPAGLGAHVHYDIPALPALRQGTGVGPGGGQLLGNCTSTGVISCDTVPGSLVTVEVDDIANTITAKVRRIDLRDRDGNFLAVDGTKLSEVQIFQGIASCQGVVVTISTNCDTADMSLNIDDDGAYVLGQPR